MTLAESIGHPVLFHTLLYYGKNGLATSTSGYDSRDPNIIAHQLNCMQALGGEGAGVVALTYGPTVSAFIHEAVMRMATACNAKGMPFAMCFDPWTVKNADGSMPNQATKDGRVIAALQNPDIQSILAMDNYLPGKPVLDFSINADKVTIQAAVPGISYWLESVDYDWPLLPPIPTKTPMPCGYIQFDDGTGKDRNKQVWDQTQPVRLIPSLHGKTFWGSTFSKANNCGGKDYVQIVTWNDYDEQTCIEPWASMAMGVKI